MAKSRVLSEFWQFLRQEKKYWLMPIVDRVRAVRPADRVLAVERRRAVHLHAVLDVPTRILGISAYYHDSAACLVEDGRIVAAAQEERFTRKKHDAGFPSQRRRVLPARGGHHARRSSISSASTRSRSSSSSGCSRPTSRCAPRGLRSYLMAMPLWLGEKLWMADDIRDRARGLRGRGAVRRASRVARRLGVLSVAVRAGRRSSPSTASASGRPRRSASAAATSSSCCASCAFRTRSACCIRRSPTSPASR